MGVVRLLRSPARPSLHGKVEVVGWRALDDEMPCLGSLMVVSLTTGAPFFGCVEVLFYFLIKSLIILG